MSEGTQIAELAAAFGVPHVETLDAGLVDPDLVTDLPAAWARRNLMLPVRWGEGIGVLTVDPGNGDALHRVAVALGCEVTPLAAARELILSGIEACYFAREHSPSSFLVDMSGTADDGTATSAGGEEQHDLLSVAATAPVSQLINLILLDAIKQRASDIHFEPEPKRLRIRYRIDGVLYEQAAPPVQMILSLVSRLKVMAHMDIAERRLPQDGMTRVTIGDRECDIRVSTIPVADGERVVLRLLDKQSALLPLTALGMQADCLDRVRELIDEPSGMLAVCGPTGSGKTTTLYAALGMLDAAHRNILTIEDPIEYRLDNIGQIQVKPKIGLTFAAGLRHILRQDPDVVLVGEIRDGETAEIAIRAALTGHMVFSTLHTNDAAGSVIRLLDMGIDRYLVAACLRAVLAQRLVRRLCPTCRREVALTAEVARRLGDATLSGRLAYAAEGCPECRDGFRGRAGLFELLVVDEGLRHAIHGGVSEPDALRRLALEGGMLPLLACGRDRILDGTTTPAEVLRAAAV